MIEFGPATFLKNEYKGLPFDGRITLRYGVIDALHPVPHSGTDIAAPEGTPIMAPASGRVFWANSDQSNINRNGNYIMLEHFDESGVRIAITQYLHMQRPTHRIRPTKFRAGDGEWVERGSVIGYVGSTGFSTGPHLHWMCSLYSPTGVSTKVDPLSYVVQWPRDSLTPPMSKEHIVPLAHKAWGLTTPGVSIEQHPIEARGKQRWGVWTVKIRL